MKQRGGEFFLSILVVAIFVIAMLLTLASVHCQTLEYVGPPIFDTSHQPDDPLTKRALSLDVMAWDGINYLVVNLGNEVRLWRIDDPLHPHQQSTSRFRVPPYGDRDYNLYRVDTCDDCRYGVAAYQTQGSVLFDLGSLATPRFSADVYYPDASVTGAATFKHGNHQYLVMNQLPDSCGSATVYTFDGVFDADRQAVQCLERPGGGAMVVSGGEYHDGWLYLIDQEDVVQIYEVGYGAPLLTHRSSVTLLRDMTEGVGGRTHGLRFDHDARMMLAGGVWGLKLYSIGNPAVPLFLHHWDPATYREENAVAIRHPFMWAGSKGILTWWMWDESVTEVSPNFHDTLPRWEWANVQDGLIVDDYLWLAQYSVILRIRIDDSGSLNEIFADGFESGGLSAW
jgi:hypothetical protein